MQNIYETFEFNAIKDHLLEYAKTELAKVYINELVMTRCISFSRFDKSMN